MILMQLSWNGKKWSDHRLFQVETNPERRKYYVLEMFPYPSGDPHMGHVKNYVIEMSYVILPAKALMFSIPWAMTLWFACGKCCN